MLVATVWAFFEYSDAYSVPSWVFLAAYYSIVAVAVQPSLVASILSPAARGKGRGRGGGGGGGGGGVEGRRLLDHQ